MKVCYIRPPVTSQCPQQFCTTIGMTQKWHTFFFGFKFKKSIRKVLRKDYTKKKEIIEKMIIISLNI